MTIPNTFPSDKLRPGNSAEFDLTSGSRGLTPTLRRLLLIAMKRSTGSATTAVPVQVFNESKADDLFGQGSELALMARAAFKTSVEQTGGPPQIWAIPMVENGAGTAGTGTFVITGPATASGNILFSIAGRKFSAPIANAATATAAGDAMVAAVNAALSEVPGTVANAAGTVTYTHRHKGVGGNDVVLSVEEIGRAHV